MKSKNRESTELIRKRSKIIYEAVCDHVVGREKKLLDLAKHQEDLIYLRAKVSLISFHSEEMAVTQFDRLKEMVKEAPEDFDGLIKESSSDYERNLYRLAKGRNWSS